MAEIERRRAGRCQRDARHLRFARGEFPVGDGTGTGFAQVAVFACLFGIGEKTPCIKIRDLETQRRRLHAAAFVAAQASCARTVRQQRVAGAVDELRGAHRVHTRRSGKAQRRHRTAFAAYLGQHCVQCRRAPALLHQFVQHGLQYLGINGHPVVSKIAAGLCVVKRAAPHPGLHRLQNFQANTAHLERFAVGERAKRRDVRVRRHAAQIPGLFNQQRIRAAARRAHRSRHARRAAARHDHIVLFFHRLFLLES